MLSRKSLRTCCSMASYSRPTSLLPDVKRDVFEKMRDTTFAVFLNDCKLPVGVEYVSDLDAHCGRTTRSGDVYLESAGLLIDTIAITQIPECFGYEALARSEISIRVTDDAHAAHIRDILLKDREWARRCTAAWLEETLDESEYPCPPSFTYRIDRPPNTKYAILSSTCSAVAGPTTLCAWTSAASCSSSGGVRPWSVCWA